MNNDEKRGGKLKNITSRVVFTCGWLYGCAPCNQTASQYLSITNVSGANARQRRRMKRYGWLWDEASALLRSVAPPDGGAAFAFDGLAVRRCRLSSG